MPALPGRVLSITIDQQLLLTNCHQRLALHSARRFFFVFTQCLPSSVRNRAAENTDIKNSFADMSSKVSGDTPIQIRKPPTLHLKVGRVEAPNWLSVHSALHLRDTAITGGRTGLGAPHVKPSVRPSIFHLFRPHRLSFSGLRDKALQPRPLPSGP